MFYQQGDAVQLALSSYIPPTANNLAPIPGGWGMLYGSGPQITSYDYSVTHNGHVSIRVDAHVQGVDINYWREVNTKQIIPVSPGDHIVFKVWVKTGPSTIGKDCIYPSSVVVGFDYYSATHRLREHSSDNPRCDIDPTWQTQYDDPGVFIPMNSDWILRILDTIVPTQVWDDSIGRLATEPIIGIIGILVAGSYTNWVNGVQVQDEGQVWFADAELYINP